MGSGVRYTHIRIHTRTQIAEINLKLKYLLTLYNLPNNLNTNNLLIKYVHTLYLSLIAKSSESNSCWPLDAILEFSLSLVYHVSITWPRPWYTNPRLFKNFHVFYGSSVCGCVTLFMYFSAAVCVMVLHVFYSSSVSWFSVSFSAAVCVSWFPCILQQQCVMVFRVFYSSRVCHDFPCV
jgi:hypothetical protein